MSERLHILSLPEWYPSPENPVAGIFVRDQVRAVALRHDVTVLAPPSVAAAAATREDGFETLRLPSSRGLGKLRTLALLRAVDATVGRLQSEGHGPDVIHAHVFSAGMLAVLTGRRRGVPVVISEHHSDVMDGLVVGWNARVARFAYRRADLVCPVSFVLARSLLALEPRTRCEVVGNVVEVDFFARPPRPPRPRSSLVAVASLTRHKGLPFLLEALRGLALEHPDIRLEIVGDGPDRASLQALAGTLPVTFAGALDRNDVKERLVAADVFVMPSLVETFGIAAAEAMAAGLPVVCTSACGVAEMVESHGGRVVPPADPAALQEAIASLLGGDERVPPGTIDDLRRSNGAEAISLRWDAIYRRVARPGDAWTASATL